LLLPCDHQDTMSNAPDIKKVVRRVTLDAHTGSVIQDVLTKDSL